MKPVTCPICGGKKKIHHPAIIEKVTCYRCNGTGRIIQNTGKLPESIITWVVR